MDLPAISGNYPLKGSPWLSKHLAENLAVEVGCHNFKVLIIYQQSNSLLLDKIQQAWLG